MSFATRRVTALLLALGLLLLAPAAYGQPTAAAAGTHDPIIFVHGYDGSGGQFESQRLRFVENRYADSYVQVLEYDSSPATPLPGAGGLNPVGIRLIEQQLFPRLDQLVAQLKTQTGRPQVELVAHSLGTILMRITSTARPSGPRTSPTT